MRKKLPNFVKEWRKFRGFNQERVAERIGKSVSAVSRAETSTNGLTTEMIELLADALGCEDPRDLFFPLPNHPEADVVDLVRRLKSPTEKKQVVRFIKAITGDAA